VTISALFKFFNRLITPLATEEVEFERIATAARPGSSIKTAFQPRPLTSQRAQQARSRGSGVAHSSDGRLNSSRPGSAAVPTWPGGGNSRWADASWLSTILAERSPFFSNPWPAFPIRIPIYSSPEFTKELSNQRRLCS